MKAFLIYQFEVAICLALFYGFFQLILKQENQFVGRRIYFLAALVFSFTLPALNIELYGNNELITLPIYYQGLIPLQSDISTIQPNPTDYWYILFILWSIGALAILFRLIVSLINTYSIVRQTSAVSNDHQIRIASDKIQSFSFFKLVVIKRSHYESLARPYIVDHELAHSKQFHSIDVLLIELIKTIQWFNPFIWLLGNQIILNLEFLADQTVLEKHQNLENYQLTLLNYSGSSSYKPLKIDFSKMQLKLRMLMMGMPKTRINLLRWFALVPFLLFLAISFSVKGGHKKIRMGLSKSMNELLGPLPRESNYQLTIPETTAPHNSIKHSSEKSTGSSVYVNGKVVASGGPIIAGATILIKGTETGTISNKMGDFFIEAPKNSILVISFPGYYTVESLVKSSTDTLNAGFLLMPITDDNPDPNSNISARNLSNPVWYIDEEIYSQEEGNKLLKEIGHENIKSISVYSKDSKILDTYGEKAKNGILIVTLKDSNETNNALQDSLIRHKEEPSLSEPQSLRDYAKVTLFSEYPERFPLFILDGVEFENDYARALLKDMDPDNIEKITVLKDVSSTKKYGEKGKNGVIIIESKKTQSHH